MSAIQAAESHFLSDMDGQTGRWVACFEQLYMTDPPSKELPVGWLQMAVANPFTDEAPSS